MQRTEIGAVRLNLQGALMDAFDGCNGVDNIQDRQVPGIIGEQEATVQSSLRRHQPTQHQPLHEFAKIGERHLTDLVQLLLSTGLTIVLSDRDDSPQGIFNGLGNHQRWIRSFRMQEQTSLPESLGH